MCSSCQKDDELISLDQLDSSILLKSKQYVKVATNKEFKKEFVKNICWTDANLFSKYTPVHNHDNFSVIFPVNSDNPNILEKLLIKCVDGKIEGTLFLFDFKRNIDNEKSYVQKLSVHELIRSYKVNINVIDLDTFKETPFLTLKKYSYKSNGGYYMGICNSCHINNIETVEINDYWYNDTFPPDFGPQIPMPGIGYIPDPNTAPEVEGPEEPIEDVDDYLECFNADIGAKLTVYVLQPVPNSNATHSGTSVGHAFISIQQGNHIMVIGFYPVSNWITPLTPSGTGIYGNDSKAYYNVSITKNINSGRLQNILNYIYNNQDATYNLNTYNCADFAIDIGNLAGLNLPDSVGEWPGGEGSNPGVLGQYIRNMSGSTKSNSSLKAPKSKKCN